MSRPSSSLSAKGCSPDATGWRMLATLISSPLPATCEWASPLVPRSWRGVYVRDGGLTHRVFGCFSRPRVPSPFTPMAHPDTALETFSRDAQAETPATRVSLSRVGVVGVEKVIRVDTGTFHAELECYVDLNPEQAGVHMSRFEEIVNETIDQVVLSESLRAEGLAGHIAERVRERQDGLRAEVRIAARYPEIKPAPVSEIPTQEI